MEIRILNLLLRKLFGEYGLNLWAKLLPIITLNQVDLPILYWAELDNQRPALRVGVHFVDDAYISQKDMVHMFLSNAWK